MQAKMTNKRPCMLALWPRSSCMFSIWMMTAQSVLLCLLNAGLSGSWDRTCKQQGLRYICIIEVILLLSTCSMVAADGPHNTESVIKQQQVQRGHSHNPQHDRIAGCSITTHDSFCPQATLRSEGIKCSYSLSSQKVEIQNYIINKVNQFKSTSSPAQVVSCQGTNFVTYLLFCASVRGQGIIGSM